MAASAGVRVGAGMGGMGARGKRKERGTYYQKT
jgi:hypothetical protein